MIEVHGLIKRYGDLEAIRGVTFTIGSGEIVGLLGPNGAGKTTIMKVLTCYHSPSAGSVKVNGYDVIDESLEVRRTVGYLPENAPVYRDLKVIEYLDFVAGMRGFRKSEKKARIEKALSLCGLTEVVYRTIGKLSKGYRQRVGLAQAILHEPQTLILDEPTSGLDPNQIIEIRNLVWKLGKEKTVILSTHILQEVEIMCKNVLILNNGMIVASGKASEIGVNAHDTKKFIKLTLEDAGIDALNEALEQTPHGAFFSKPIIRGNRISFDITIDAPMLESSISQWAMDHHFRIVEMVTKVPDLEEIFRKLTTSEKQQ